MNMEVITKEFDVVIIGGGIAGCMAAIRASDFGVKIAILEKANTLRSGSASTGIDHCWTYIPEIHGKMLSLEELIEDHTTFAGGMIDQSLIRIIAENSYLRILDLEKFGLEMRDSNGNFRLVKKIHRAPTFLHFAGRDLKVKLTKEVRKRDVTIANRMMVTDLLVEDGRITGVLALSTREGKWYIYRSKAVIISTGGVNRLFRNPNGMPFNVTHPPHCSGDGHAMAFRSGARLLNMEIVNIHTGPKNFHRAGRGSYVPGRMSDGLGNLLGKNDNANPNQKTLDRTAEGVDLFQSKLENGLGPIYMDCTKNSPEENEYIRWALNNEGNTSFLNYLDQEGINLNNDRIEFTFYEPKMNGGEAGIEINTRCESSITGLFAAGDVIGGIKRSVCPGALVMGYNAGENAAKISEMLSIGKLQDQSIATINERMNLGDFFQSLEKGSTWQEAQLALQNIMSDYADKVKSSSLLKAGLSNIQQFREQALAEIKVNSPHELFRAMEVLGLIDVGEMLIMASYERKESRGGFYRVDFPKTDSQLQKFITLRQKDGKTEIEFRPINLS